MRKLTRKVLGIKASFGRFDRIQTVLKLFVFVTLQNKNKAASSILLRSSTYSTHNMIEQISTLTTRRVYEKEHNL